MAVQQDKNHVHVVACAAHTMRSLRKPCQWMLPPARSICVTT